MSGKAGVLRVFALCTFVFCDFHSFLSDHWFLALLILTAICSPTCYSIFSLGLPLMSPSALGDSPFFPLLRQPIATKPATPKFSV